MFCYDGFLTYVLLVKCALLADLCVDSKERNKLNNYSAWFSFAGSGNIRVVACQYQPLP